MGMSSSGVANTAGPLLIGLLFSSVALGVLTVQVFIHYVAFPKDTLRLKVVVWSIYILELIQTILIAYTLYRQFVFGFLDGVSSLDTISWNWLAVPILGEIVTFIVQNFYVHRILVLGGLLKTKRASLIAVLVVILSFVQLITGFLVGAELQQSVFYSHIDFPKIEKSAAIFYVAGTISDTIIAVCMTIILLRSSSQSLQRTRKIVRRLVRLTIEAGSLTAVMSIITIILVIVPAYETYYQLSAAALSKLYSNAMMAVLLNRIELAKRDSSTTSTSLVESAGAQGEGHGHSSTIWFSHSQGEESMGCAQSYDDGLSRSHVVDVSNCA